MAIIASNFPSTDEFPESIPVRMLIPWAPRERHDEVATSYWPDAPATGFTSLQPPVPDRVSAVSFPKMSRVIVVMTPSGCAMTNGLS